MSDSETPTPTLTGNGSVAHPDIIGYGHEACQQVQRAMGNKIKSQKAEIGVLMDQLGNAQEEIVRLRGRVLELEHHLAAATNTDEGQATNAAEVAAINDDEVSANDEVATDSADEAVTNNLDVLVKTEPSQPNYAAEPSASWEKIIDQAWPGQRRNFLPVIAKRVDAAVKQWHLNTLGPAQAALCFAVSPRTHYRLPAIPESLQTKFLEWLDGMVDEGLFNVPSKDHEVKRESKHQEVKRESTASRINLPSKDQEVKRESTASRSSASVSTPATFESLIRAAKEKSKSGSPVSSLIAKKKRKILSTPGGKIVSTPTKAASSPLPPPSTGKKRGRPPLNRKSVRKSESQSPRRAKRRICFSPSSSPEKPIVKEDPEFEEEEEEEEVIAEGDGGVPLFEAPASSAKDMDALAALAAVCGSTFSPLGRMVVETSAREIETCPLHDEVGKKKERERVAEVDGGEVAIPAAAEKPSLEKIPTNAPILEWEFLEPITPDGSPKLTALSEMYWDDHQETMDCEPSPMNWETPAPRSNAAASIAISNTNKERGRKPDVPSSLTACSNMHWDDHEPSPTWTDSPGVDVVLVGSKRLMRESPLSLTKEEHDQMKKRKGDAGNGSEVVVVEDDDEKEGMTAHVGGGGSDGGSLTQATDPIVTSNANALVTPVKRGRGRPKGSTKAKASPKPETPKGRGRPKGSTKAKASPKPKTHKGKSPSTSAGPSSDSSATPVADLLPAGSSPKPETHSGRYASTSAVPSFNYSATPVAYLPPAGYYMGGMPGDMCYSTATWPLPGSQVGQSDGAETAWA
ncbi:hypothetical protein HK104_001964 [Borealophlyctis nickersoniae]|nr:hypothetical protein HK104_001964 [Borealophlyctis nickersoniae]